MRGPPCTTSHCPGKLYFPGRGGTSVKRLKSSQASSLHSWASGPSSITSTIWLRWDMSCRAVVTMPGSAEGEVPDGPEACSLRVELAPSVALGASNPGGGATLCVSAVEASDAPGSTRLLVRVVIIPRPTTDHCQSQAGWRMLRMEHHGTNVSSRLTPGS